MISIEYDELLKRAKKNLPEMHTSKRFVMPQAIAFSDKRFTRIKNFLEIARTLRREPEHLAKFLFKELAVPGSIQNNELVLQGRIHRSMINSRIKDYVNEYVLCHECKRPDTTIQKDGKMVIIKCEACGAKRVVKK